MARFEFKQDPPDEDWLDHGTRLLNLIVRGLGLVLLLIGLIVALTVIVSAWSLYTNPENIEVLARAVERGSNLDLTLANVTQAGQQQLDPGVLAADGAAAPAAGTATPAQPAFRFSYFAAWLIAILLLLLRGRLSIAAVRTGGELALYDIQVKKLAQALIKERARSS